LRKLNNDGRTILHVTHDYNEAISLAKRVAVLNNGKIIQSGNIREVFQHPKSEFIANFIGINNFFKAELIKNENNQGQRVIISDDIEIYILTEQSEGEGYIIIRSEDIFISETRSITSARNCFKGTITEIFPSNLGFEVIVDIGIRISALITYQSLKKLNLIKGKEVWISFKASAVKFIKS
jgi:molybdopterin-binding protein